MKNKIYRTLLVFLVFTLGESIFAEAKPLPDFNVEKVNWGTQRYKFTLIKKEEKIEMGSVTLSNKLTGDRVILTDEFLLRIEGKPISLNMMQVCLKDQYLSPVKIECKGKGDEEFPTFKATIKDGQAKIEGPRDGMMEIPKGTVTSAAFMRIVTQLPRVQGATYRYDFALEASEMNLKKEYLVKVIGKETIICDGEPVKCWKISQNGGGIREQLFWVTENGILQRILMDGSKQIDLQTGEPGD
ncbi:MAG: hypothetical protein O3A82_02865 [Verrucomicrobia bacterium]|nr:hypothetical protein [Verrucomicrobiota bacterium]MDA0722858.1 hypothetical protein [Verrucomicrobiota bacterium]MDA1045851.1 hypothetical protein [Verrucomicrobiota bacterium]